MMLLVLTASTKRLITSRLECESGQGLAEYALILSFIVLIAIAALTAIGSDVSSFLHAIAGSPF
jgi:Flp pilus assembly pilin Flp